MTAITLPSSTPEAARLRCLAPRIHALGTRSLYELLRQLAAKSSAVLDAAEQYAAIDGDVLSAFGGDRMPPTLRVMK